jgi:23S rRNA (uracil1939-C5)-methyltransferase
MQYPAQVEAKRSILEELFRHRFPETAQLAVEMRPSPQAQGYRSRARIQTRGHGSAGAAGFFAFQSHEVVDVARCPLFRPSLNEALTEFRGLLKRGEIHPGVRQAEVACSQDEGEWTWVEIERAAEAGYPPRGDSSESVAESRVLNRKVGEFEYYVTPRVFFQANDYMVSELLASVQELACIPKADTALDLFAGVGLFTLPIARAYRAVTAVESSGEASRLCGENALRCGLSNVRVVCADAAAWIKAISSVAVPKFDLILLDPPRTGAGSEIMQGVAGWCPETILYVSCDPQTLVRDLALPSMNNYRIDVVRGLDLFPQTYHFETLVRLKRR